MEGSHFTTSLQHRYWEIYALSCQYETGRWSRSREEDVFSGGGGKRGGGVWERGIWNVEGESRMVNGAPLRLLRPLPLHQAIFFSVKQAPQPENKTSSEPRPPLEKTQQAHASSEKLYTL